MSVVFNPCYWTSPGFPWEEHGPHASGHCGIAEEQRSGLRAAAHWHGPRRHVPLGHPASHHQRPRCFQRGRPLQGGQNLRYTTSSSVLTFERFSLKLFGFITTAAYNINHNTFYLCSKFSKTLYSKGLKHLWIKFTLKILKIYKQIKCNLLWNITKTTGGGDQ